MWRGRRGGKEVEELNCKEIFEALAARVSVEDLLKHPRREKRPPEFPKEVIQWAKELEGTLEAVLLNEKMELIERLPVSQLAERLQHVGNVDTVVFDGIITQRIVDIASEKNIKNIIASRISEAVKTPLNVQLATFSDLFGN
jgi:DNA primase